MLSFGKIPLLIGQLIIGALIEEIAFRGFFVGKGMKLFPYWLCMLVSSAVFAAGHYYPGDIAVVAFDLLFIFIDSLIFSAIYRKTGNCVVSAIAHFLANSVGLILLFACYSFRPQTSSINDSNSSGVIVNTSSVPFRCSTNIFSSGLEMIVIALGSWLPKSWYS